jgi:sugar O-acyltransferase (sialic acid O-acetyltransferase NeuD family)
MEVSMRQIAIVGAGGFGREVLAVLEEQVARTASLHGTRLLFVDDAKAGQTINGVEVVTAASYAALEGERRFVVAIANSAAREREALRLAASGARPFTVQAGNALLFGTATIGEGAVVAPFAFVSANANIGRQFHLNYHSYVAHDCVIGDFVTFAPGVKCNGGVVIEDHAYIGSGAVIKQAQPGRPVVIGRGAVVGMGAVVTKSVPAGVTVVGNPARPLGSA